MSNGGYTVLPTKPQTRATLQVDPLSARILLAGMPKAGKSTLLSQWAPQTTLILDTHRGTTLLDGEHFVQHVNDWATFEDTVDLIVGGNHPFKTIGLDLVDDIYTMADRYVAKRAGKATASLIEFGKGSKETDALFMSAVAKLLATPYGIWFLSHTDTEEVKDKRGNVTATRLIPRLDKRVRTYVEGVCQFIFLAEVNSGTRKLRTKPDAQFGAGSRVPLPSPMPMDARALYGAMGKGLNPKTPAAPAPDPVEPEPDPQPDGEGEPVQETLA
jgi:hypothetical protein